MAVRIHVTVARGCPVGEVRAVFGEILGAGFEAVPVHERDGWTWFRTSVWGVGGGDLNRGLCRLGRPGLQFTTSDGDRWFLAVHGGPRGPEAFLHEFGLLGRPAEAEPDDEEDIDDEPATIDPDLAFLEDPPEAPPRPRTPIDRVAEGFAEMGAPLPEPLIEDLRDLPRGDAVNRLRERLADAIPAAIKGAGMPVDGPRLRSVLLWDGVTDRERYGDLGNLPRLLSALGLGGEWDDYIRECESASDEDARAACDGRDNLEPEPGPDHAGDVLRLVGDLPMATVRGGPVSIPPAKLPRLGFPARACSTDGAPMMAVVLSLPEGQPNLPPADADPSDDRLRVDTEGRSIRIGAADREAFGRRNLERVGGADLVELVRHPPEETAMEIGFAVPDEPAACQRFRGTVRGGRLRVEESHPASSREALRDAIRLAGSERGTEVACRDEAEALELVEAAGRDPDLHGLAIRRDGRTVACDFGPPGQLALGLLRLRHADTWDVHAPLERGRRQLEELAAMARQMRRAGAEAARKRAAPHDPEILLRGEHSTYWRSDFLRLDGLDPGPREAFDVAMADLRFAHVGDLVCKRQRDIMLRVFLSADAECYGVLMGKRTMYLGSEFVSRLEDGSGLTTTTNAAVDSEPRAGIYYRSFPGLEPEPLLARHRQGLDRFRRHKGVGPVRLGASLIDVAREIEVAFGRQKVAEQFLFEEDEEG